MTAIIAPMSALTAVAVLLCSTLTAQMAGEPPEEIFPPVGYLEKSLVATLAIAKEMEARTPALGLADGSSVFSAHLAPGAEISLTHGASKGEVFMAAAAPDDPKLDINLWITDKDEKELAKDTAESAACMAAFKASDDRGFEFKLRNDGSEDAFVTIILMKNEGFGKRLTEAGEAIKVLLTAIRTLSVLDEGISFASDGEWCLYGGMLKKQTSFTIEGLVLRAPVSVFMGACSSGSKDIDILLSDKEGAAVASDEEDDNRPVVEVNKKLEGVRALLGNSGGDAFCVMAAIDATK